VRALLPALLALLHLAVASAPCPAERPDGPAAGDAARFSIARVHASHTLAAPGTERAGTELRAPCPCRCHQGEGAPLARLGPALLPAPPSLARPACATPLVARASGLAFSRSASPDPVPRAA
jgi:hypothetical protein